MEGSAAMSYDHRAIAEAHIKAWSVQDVDAIVACFAPDGVFDDVPLKSVFEGHEGVRAFATAAFAAIPDFSQTIRTLTVDGEIVCFESVFSGTQTGDFPGIPATGKPFEIRCMTIEHIRDGLIHLHRDYWSLADYLQQVGLMPSPEA